MLLGSQYWILRGISQSSKSTPVSVLPGGSRVPAWAWRLGRSEGLGCCPQLIPLCTRADLVGSPLPSPPILISKRRGRWSSEVTFKFFIQKSICKMSLTGTCSICVLRGFQSSSWVEKVFGVKQGDLAESYPNKRSKTS